MMYPFLTSTGLSNINNIWCQCVSLKNKQIKFKTKTHEEDKIFFFFFLWINLLALWSSRQNTDLVNISSSEFNIEISTKSMQCSVFLNFESETFACLLVWFVDRYPFQIETVKKKNSKKLEEKKLIERQKWNEIDRIRKKKKQQKNKTSGKQEQTSWVCVERPRRFLHWLCDQWLVSRKHIVLHMD